MPFSKDHYLKVKQVALFFRLRVSANPTKLKVVTTALQLRLLTTWLHLCICEQLISLYLCFIVVM